MASSKRTPPRPGISHSHSHYVQMLLQQDHIPRLHNMLAALFVWLLLAGFLVFPGTFTQMKDSIPDETGDDDKNDEDSAASVKNTATQAILHGVKNTPLLVAAAVICGLAAIGMLFLALRHRKNYVWLVNRLFVPGMASSLAGILSTLVGVYTQQEGVWSVTAKVTAVVIGALFGVCGGLWIVIELGPLKRIRKRHGRHYEGRIETGARMDGMEDGKKGSKGDKKSDVREETKTIT